MQVLRRRGFFFTIDAMIALIVMAVGFAVIFAPMPHQPEQQQILDYSTKTLSLLGSREVRELADQEIAKLWCDDCPGATHEVTYPDSSVLEQIVEFAVVPKGLVSRWSAEGDAGDSVGDNPGTLIGGTTFAPGRFGQAFSLDGSGDEVDVPVSAVLDVRMAFTLEAWVAASAWKPGIGIIQRYTTAIPGGPGFNLNLESLTGATYRCNVDDGPSDYDAFSTTFVTPGTFQHVVCTFNGTTLRTYIDGVLEASTPAAPAPAINGEVYIGPGFPGMIDEASIYNRALSGTEVDTAFRTGSPQSERALLLWNRSIGGLVPSSFSYNLTVTASGLTRVVAVRSLVPADRSAVRIATPRIVFVRTPAGLQGPYTVRLDIWR